MLICQVSNLPPCYASEPINQDGAGVWFLPHSHQIVGLSPGAALVPLKVPSSSVRLTALSKASPSHTMPM